MPNPNPFDERRLNDVRTALVAMEPTDEARYEYLILAQYTRTGLAGIKIGDLVAVENFTPTSASGKTYSILTLTEVRPQHFATQGPDAYPGHMFEAMRSIKEEWETQDSQAKHHTTTIALKAVSTGLQFTHNTLAQQLPDPETEQNQPMIGATMLPLAPAMVDNIINRGLQNYQETPFKHRQVSTVTVKLNWDRLFTTHLGVFGFTGVGKSNLVSSLVHSLQSEPNLKSNTILVDPNDEYLGLLIDKFVASPNDINYVSVGASHLSDVIRDEVGKPSQSVTQLAVDAMHKQLVLPTALAENKAIQPFIKQGLREAISSTIFVFPEDTMQGLLTSEVEEQVPHGIGPQFRGAVEAGLEAWTRNRATQEVNPANLNAALQELQAFNSPIRGAISRNATQDGIPDKVPTIVRVFERAANKMQKLSRDMGRLHPASIKSIPQIVDELNNTPTRRTLIIAAESEIQMKRFVSKFVRYFYEVRKKQAIQTPRSLVFLDEADLYIPNEDPDEFTTEIKRASVLLARRGRKFGLGIGISTQRSTHLDTNVMANLHTYLVSKLPRAADRERVAEAFGIGEEQLTPTFTFQPGDWLLISHGATGIKGVPIPSSAVDANNRITTAATAWKPAPTPTPPAQTHNPAVATGTSNAPTTLKTAPSPSTHPAPKT